MPTIGSKEVLRSQCQREKIINQVKILKLKNLKQEDIDMILVFFKKIEFILPRGISSLNWVI